MRVVVEWRGGGERERERERETERQTAMLLPENERNGKTDCDVTSRKREKRRD